MFHLTGFLSDLSGKPTNTINSPFTPQKSFFLKCNPMHRQMDL